MQIAIALAALLLVAIGIVLAVRWKLRRSPHLRTRMVAGGAAVTALGILCGVWLPTIVPDTPGSPGATVIEVILWVLGGALLFLGLPALVAAALTQPETAEAPKGDHTS